MAYKAAAALRGHRPNLGPGPETWQYQVQYLDGDELVGPLSDVLVATVPER